MRQILSTKQAFVLLFQVTQTAYLAKHCSVVLKRKQMLFIQSHLRQDDTQSPNINKRIISSHSQNHLWRFIALSTKVIGLQSEVVLKGSCESKVEQFGSQRCNKYIPRLHISVYYSQVVYILQCMRKNESITFSLSQRYFLNQLIKRYSWKKFIYKGICFRCLLKTNIKQFYEFDMFVVACQFGKEIKIDADLFPYGLRRNLLESFYHDSLIREHIYTHKDPRR